jgi:exodeoxyribonuclease III
MKIVSFNVNSVRMRMHQLQQLTDTHAPDFIGLQETKVNDDQFPIDDIKAMGYDVVFHGQKTHYGVALLSKHKIIESQKGFPTDDEDAQRRFVAARCESPLGGEITLINGYFPQGENREHATKFPNKTRFYEDLNVYLNETCSPSEAVIVMGDMNISHTDIDIGIGEDNRKRWLRTGKCSFLPEEREWMEKLLSWGLIDTYREKHPESSDYSWFDYRSRGFEREPKRGLRIDMVLATESLASRCKSAGIDYDIRGMEKPSDHAPIWAEFE